MNSACSVPTLLLAFLVLIPSLFTGCGASPQANPGRETARREEAVAAPQPRGKNTLYVTEKMAEDASGEAVSELSIIRPHRAMLRLSDVQVGRTYEATWQLQDGKGRTILTKAFEFAAREAPWTLWMRCEPDYRKHEAGRWKWTAEVRGLGRYSTEVGVLPASPADLAQLARFEKARESVFRAFAQYWLAYTNDYFTTFTQAGQGTMHVVRKEPENQRSRFLDNTTVQVRVNKEVLLQVRGLDYNFSESYVGEADRLNGIGYRGSATFGFRLYRFYAQDSGWSDWRDVVAVTGELMEALGSFLGIDEIPADLQGRLVVSFDILERDGNWFVTGNNEARFSNGKLVDKGQVLSSVPLLEPLKAALTGGVNPGREADKRMGRLGSENPEPLNQGIISTMTQLRGRPLQ